MSLNHDKLDWRRWAAVRKAALVRSGYRSEISGRPGRLECHHRVALHTGGEPYDLDNIVVMTKDEHIEHHRHEADDTPGREAWLDYVKGLAL